MNHYPPPGDGLGMLPRPCEPESAMLAGIAALFIIVASVSSALAGPPGRIDQWNAVCNGNAPAQCLAVDPSGNLPITGSVTATNPSVSTTGAAVPGSATYMGANKSGNLVAPTLDTSSNLNVNLQTAIPAGTNVIGHTITDSGSTTAATQTTAANLNATVVGTGTFAVQAAQSGTWTVTGAGGTFPITGTVGLSAGSAIVGKVGIDQTTPGTTNGVQINAAIPAGANTIGAVTQASGPWTVTGSGTAGSAASGVLTVQGIASMTKLLVTPDSVALPANQSVNISQINGVTPLMGNGTTGTGSQRVTISSDNTAFAVNAQPAPVTSGGLTWYFVQPTASDNHANIKNGAGQVYHIAVTNNQATINYLRLYNAASGFNGCNSATNLVGQWAIPGNANAAGFVEDISTGIVFSTGISICVTSGYATTDTTNATASAISVNIGYK